MANSVPSVVNSFSDIVIDSSLREGFLLGEIVVFPNKGLIVRQDAHHHVNPKAMEILFVLSCNAGRVVSRRAILGYVWGDENSHSSNLSHLMTELRHLLDDHVECPTFIQMLPRKGYRFLVQPRPIDESSLSADALKAAADMDSELSSKPKFKLFGSIDYWRHSRLLKVSGAYIVMAWVLMQVMSVTLPFINVAPWFGKLALLILIIGFPLVLSYNWWVEFTLRKHFARKHQLEAKNSRMSKHAYRDLSYITVLSLCSLGLAILLGNQVFDAAQQSKEQNAQQEIHAEFFTNAVAVMPFRLFGEQSSDFLVGLLQSEMLGFLSQSSQLKVVSERVLASLPADATLSTIRQWTGAKYVLEGVINQLGEQVHIMTTLTDSESGHNVWVNKAQVLSTNQLTLFDTISHQVFNALTFLMPQDESSTLQFRPTEDIHAYDFYVRAKLLLKDAYNQKQLKAAEQLFLNALSRDRHFELAQVGLCQTYLEQYDLLMASRIFELARQACHAKTDKSGIKVESELALGRLYLASGEYELALEHFQQSLAIDADNSLGLIGKAQALTRLGQRDAGENAFLQAIQAEPGYWRSYEQYGEFLFGSGRYFAASLQFQKQSLLQPKGEEAFNNLGAAYYLDTQFDKATQSWRKAASIKPSANIYSNMGTSLFFAKKYQQATEMYQQAVDLRPSNYMFRGNLADALKYSSAQPQKIAQQYQLALSLAQQSAAINGNDATVKASIARYHSELKNCEQATQQAKALDLSQPDDPYIYYDLALVATNCAQSIEVLANLEKALKLGYSSKLLLKDNQFSQYQNQILQMQERLSR